MFEYIKTILNGLKSFVLGEVSRIRKLANNAQETADAAKTQAASNRGYIKELYELEGESYSLASDAMAAADTAQTAADNAQTTADNAQTTANAALERVVEPYTRNTQMAPLYKNGGFSAWRGVVQEISYDKTEGYFFVNGFDTTALKGEDMPKGVFCANVYVKNKIATAFLSRFATNGNLWSVKGFAVVTEGYYPTGEVLYVSSNTISQNETKGLFLTFRAPDSMLLKSSTTDSAKQFRITVDDNGTLTATEVS